MPRYITRSWGWVEDDICWEEPINGYLEVCDHDPVWTGLLDANGDEIYRLNDPIGFHHPDEGF